MVDSWGSWSRIERATVSPPTPESKIPRGASFTRSSLTARRALTGRRLAGRGVARATGAAQVREQHVDERLLQPAQCSVDGDQVAPGRGIQLVGDVAVELC